MMNNQEENKNSINSNEEDFTNNLNQIELDKYRLLKIVNDDGYDTFYSILEESTNKKYLAKILKEPNLNNMKSFFKEAELLPRLNSPFIIKYIGFNINGFESIQNPVFITEHPLNGTLEQLISRRSKSDSIEGWNDTTRLMHIYGIASGMAYAHRLGVIHRNLKPDNIYIDEYLMPKISNFESAAYNNGAELSAGVGTISYMAPEVANEEEYGLPADVYSFSIIVHFIISDGKLPKINLTSVLKGEQIPIDKSIPETYRKLIKRCSAFDPKQRPTFDEIVMLLKADKGFITDQIDEKKFLDFVHSIEDVKFVPKTKFQKVKIDYHVQSELSVELDPIDLLSFKIIEYVGQGQYGIVYKVEEIRAHEILAAKSNIKALDECNEHEIKSLSREINALSKLNCPSVLKFIGYSQKNFDNDSCPTIITEFIKNKSLDKIIELQEHGLTPTEWNETKKLIAAYGIASGMSYIHSLNILHRDLKPGNIFFDEYLFPKIGDFGLALELKNDGIDDNKYFGTPLYSSPEILFRFEYQKAGDVYAYSMLLYQMLTLEVPFGKGITYPRLLKRILTKDRPSFDNCIIENCYKKLIEKCWADDPEARPTFSEIVECLERDEEFITDAVNREEYDGYIDYIKNNEKNKLFQNVDIDFEELKRIHQRDQELNIPFLDLKNFEKQKLIKRINNFDIFAIKNKKTHKLNEAKISTICINNLSRNGIIHLSREVNILSKLDHPSFLKFVGYSPIDFNKQLYPVIITEMPPNKSLGYFLNKERNNEKIEGWDETKKLILIYGIASGMAYLHLFNVIHRNLTPDSIFLDEFLFPKIGNFGLLQEIHTAESMTIQTTIGIKGNFSYSSPETLSMNEYSKSSDVYAFALIVYEIVTKQVPFQEIKNSHFLFDEIVMNENRPKFNTNIPERYRELIQMCWSQNPDDRPSFKEITSILKDHEFTKNINTKEFKQYVDMIEQSTINYFSRNRVIKFEELINDKNSNQENGNDGISAENRKDKKASKHSKKIKFHNAETVIDFSSKDELKSQPALKSNEDNE